MILVYSVRSILDGVLVAEIRSPYFQGGARGARRRDRGRPGRAGAPRRPLRGGGAFEGRGAGRQGARAERAQGVSAVPVGMRKYVFRSLEKNIFL